MSSNSDDGQDKTGTVPVLVHFEDHTRKGEVRKGSSSKETTDMINCANKVSKHLQMVRYIGT